MKNKLGHIMLTVATVLLFACTKMPASQTIELAESEFADGNIQSSRERCLALSDTTKELNVKQLCQVAMLYMRIAEVSDDQSDMAAAAKCYTRALRIDSDSVEIYFADLAVEQQALARMLHDLSTAVSNPDSLVEVDDEDIQEYAYNETAEQ